MSTNPDYGFPPTMPPPTGMSGTTKALLGCGILGGLALLACCGIVGFTMYKAQQAINIDPVVAQAASTSIAEVDLPEGFKALMSMDVTIPFTGIQMKFAMHEGGNPNEMAMVGEFAGGGAQTPEEMAAEMKKSMGDQKQGAEKVVPENITEHKVTIRGTESTFQIIKGKGENSGKAMWQVAGTFPGKAEGSTGMVLVTLDGDQYTEDDVKEIIESIK
jgi:hypothetical protein